MFTSHNRLTPAPVRQDAVCMCARGGACSSFAPGHAVHLIQARLVAATPSEWVDAVVTSVEPASGTIVVHGLLDVAGIELWNGAGAADAVGPALAHFGAAAAQHAAGRVYNVVAAS